MHSVNANYLCIFSRLIAVFLKTDSQKLHLALYDLPCWMYSNPNSPYSCRRGLPPEPLPLHFIFDFGILSSENNTEWQLKFTFTSKH